MPVDTGMSATLHSDNEDLRVPEQTSTPDQAESPVESPYAVLRWLVLATFVVILNETIMINAIPRLMVEFEVSARSRPVALDGLHADDGRRSSRSPAGSCSA